MERCAGDEVPIDAVDFLLAAIFAPALATAGYWLILSKPLVLSVWLRVVGLVRYL